MTTQGQNTPLQQNNRLLEIMNRHLRQQVQFYQQWFRQQQQGSSQSQPQAQSSAAPGPMPAAPAAAAPGRAGMLAGVGRAAGHPAVMAVFALASILPMFAMGAKSASEDTDRLTTSIGGLESEATSASQQLARLMTDLRRVSTAYGSNVNQMIAATAAYSAVGSQNPMADAQNFTRFIDQIRGGIVTGQPNTQQMLASAVMGINPMSVLNQSAGEYRNQVVDRMRGMTPEQRQDPQTRAYLRSLVGEDESANVLMMAEMSEERWAATRRREREMMAMAGGNMAARMSEREQALLDIGSRRQLTQFQVRSQREYLRTGGGAAPVWEETKLQLQEQLWRAQLAFWHSMLPVLEQFREMLGGISKQGGAIDTLGNVMEVGANELATALKYFIATITFAVGAIQLAVSPIAGIGHGTQMFHEFARGNLDAGLAQGQNMIDSFADPFRTFRAANRMVSQNPYDTRASMGYEPAFQHGDYRGMVNIRMVGQADDFFTAGVQSANRQGKAIRLQPQRPAASLGLEP